MARNNTSTVGKDWDMNLHNYKYIYDTCVHDIVYFRRVKHLQLKADKKRRQQEVDALYNVVQPSRQVIQDQYRVRLRKERRLRKTHGCVYN